MEGEKKGGRGGGAAVTSLWMKELLIRHPRAAYEAMPAPQVRQAVPPEQAWGEREPFPGFSEFRKYKKANETRNITTYEPEQRVKKEASGSAEDILKITIPDIKGFTFGRLDLIAVDHPETLVRLVRDYPEVGYLHLNRDRMELARNYQPYHYVVCNYDDIDRNNYATVSPNGMIEFYKGHPDFLTLDRLLLEHRLYNALCQIPSFQTFRMWKAFIIWFKKIRITKFVEAREKLKLILVFKTEPPHPPCDDDAP